MTADDMKAVVCCYWRFVRRCPLVATETTISSYGFLAEYPPDVMAVSKNGFLIETEVKLSIADLRREITKRKYRRHPGLLDPPGSSFTQCFPSRWSIAKFFYFAVPESIVERAKPVVRDLYPGAGLLAVEEPETGQFGSVMHQWLSLVMKPRSLPDARRLAVDATHALTLRVVNQMCSAMLDAANCRRNGGERDLELVDMILSVGRETP